MGAGGVESTANAAPMPPPIPSTWPGIQPPPDPSAYPMYAPPLPLPPMAPPSTTPGQFPSSPAADNHYAHQPMSAFPGMPPVDHWSPPPPATQPFASTIHSPWAAPAPPLVYLSAPFTSGANSFFSDTPDASLTYAPMSCGPCSPFPVPSTTAMPGPSPWVPISSPFPAPAAAMPSAPPLWPPSFPPPASSAPSSAPPFQFGGSPFPPPTSVPSPFPAMAPSTFPVPAPIFPTPAPAPPPAMPWFPTPPSYSPPLPAPSSAPPAFPSFSSSYQSFSPPQPSPLPSMSGQPLPTTSGAPFTFPPPPSAFPPPPAMHTTFSPPVYNFPTPPFNAPAPPPFSVQMMSPFPATLPILPPAPSTMPPSSFAIPLSTMSLYSSPFGSALPPAPSPAPPAFSFPQSAGLSGMLLPPSASPFPPMMSPCVPLCGPCATTLPPCPPPKPVPCPPEIKTVTKPPEVKIVERPAAETLPEDPKLRARIEELEEELAHVKGTVVDVPALQDELAQLRENQRKMRGLYEEIQNLRNGQRNLQALEEERMALREAQQRVPALEQEIATLRTRLTAQSETRSRTSVNETYKVKSFDMAAKLAKMDGTDDGLYNGLPIEVEGEGLYIDLVRAGRVVSSEQKLSSTSRVQETYKVKTFEMAAKLAKMDGTDDGLYNGMPIEVEGEGLYRDLVRAGRKEKVQPAVIEQMSSRSSNVGTYKVQTFEMAAKLAKMDPNNEGMFNGLPIEVQGEGLYIELVRAGRKPRTDSMASNASRTSVSSTQTYKVRTLELAAKLAAMSGAGDGTYKGLPIEVEGQGLYADLQKSSQ